MSPTKISMDQFTQDREEALRSLDLVKVRAYMAKYGMPQLDNDLILLAAVHKARVALYGLDRHAKKVSKDWLIANGFKASIG